jgi:BirA family biotin operon repressor/biotin-[acetyl-CoA-carboxylase] ligase
MSAPNVAELDPGRIGSLLCTRSYGRSLELLASTDSTSDDARRAAEAGAPDGHVVLAESQHRGRGQQGRTWASPPGTDLYLSIVARPRLPFAALPPLTLAVGLGVADASEQLLAHAQAPRAQVKWPNDVLLGGQKCAGILVETSSAAQPQREPGAAEVAVVIGIGLNVNRLDWPDELRPLATSLRAHRPGAERVDRGIALAALLACVERWVDALVARGGDAIASELDARLALRGQRVRCGDCAGTLLGVAPSGAVRIATDLGVRELIAGRIAPVS